MTFDYNFLSCIITQLLQRIRATFRIARTYEKNVGQSYAKMWLCYLSFSYSTVLALTSYGVK